MIKLFTPLALILTLSFPDIFNIFSKCIQQIDSAYHSHSRNLLSCLVNFREPVRGSFVLPLIFFHPEGFPASKHALVFGDTWGGSGASASRPQLFVPLLFHLSIPNATHCSCIPRWWGFERPFSPCSKDTSLLPLPEAFSNSLRALWSLLFRRRATPI